MDAEKIKKDFPIFKKRVNGKAYAYLDNAATSQRPKQVIEAMDGYYEGFNANVHRGVYRHSEEATEKYEQSREKLGKFLDVGKEREVVFTRNASEAVNLVAYSWGEQNIGRGDKIVVTIMEHHSNFVPWQQLVMRKGARLEIIDITGNYELNDNDLAKIEGAKMVAATHVSNAIGTINDVKEICKIAGEAGSVSFIDGAQSAPHMPTSLRKIKCNFFALTGHKMLGPTGIGALVADRELLKNMQPFLFGGDMINEVHVYKSAWNDVPYKFEAGTPNIAGAIGLGAAVDYLQKIGMERIRKHEMDITKYAIRRMKEIEGVELYGTRELESHAGIIAFNVEGVHPHDVAGLLDEQGIAIRSGHHCAMPLHTRLGLNSTNRASFYLYNGRKDVDALADAILGVKKIFSGAASSGTEKKAGKARKKTGRKK